MAFGARQTPSIGAALRPPRVGISLPALSSSLLLSHTCGALGTPQAKLLRTAVKMWLSPSEPAGALWVLGRPRTAQHPPPAAGHRLLKGTCWAFVSTLRTAAHHWRADEDLAGTDPSSESLRLRDFAPCRQELPASALLRGLVPADTVRYQSNVVDATCPA